MNLQLIIAGLASAGRLTLANGNITLDGQGIALPGQLSPPTQAVEYGPDGWSVQESPIGGRRSKLVDELIIALHQANYPDVADRIPTWHVFVNPPEGAVETLSYGNDPGTLAALDPNNRSRDTHAQAMENVRAYHNNVFGQLIANDVATLNAVFHGGPDGGFPRAQIGNINDPAVRRPYTAQPGGKNDPIDLDWRFKNPLKQVDARKLENVDKPQQGEMNALAYSAFADHFVYPLLVNTTTDTPVARIWHSWVRMIGVRVAA